MQKAIAIPRGLHANIEAFRSVLDDATDPGVMIALAKPPDGADLLPEDQDRYRSLSCDAPHHPPFYGNGPADRPGDQEPPRVAGGAAQAQGSSQRQESGTPAAMWRFTKNNGITGGFHRMIRLRPARHRSVRAINNILHPHCLVESLESLLEWCSRKDSNFQPSDP